MLRNSWNRWFMNTVRTSHDEMTVKGEKSRKLKNHGEFQHIVEYCLFFSGWVSEYSSISWAWNCVRKRKNIMSGPKNWEFQISTLKRIITSMPNLWQVRLILQNSLFCFHSAYNYPWALIFAPRNTCIIAKLCAKFQFEAQNIRTWRSAGRKPQT